MTQEDDKHTAIPFPRARQPIIDSLRQARQMNVIHALLEVDVTDARRQIREFRRRTGSPLSLTTFLTFCLAQAVAENKSLQAYRKGGKLVIFDDVDIMVPVEREFAGDKTPVLPPVIKAANRKSLGEIQSEITAAKTRTLDEAKNKSLANLYWYTPGLIRHLLWRTWLGSPYWRKKMTGTVGISVVGVFGKGVGWGIPIPTYTLSVTVGSIAEKPGIVKGRIEAREFLSLTASFDHDIIDGAPAARFCQRFKELIEGGWGLGPA